MHLLNYLTAVLATASFTQAIALPRSTSDIEARDFSPNEAVDSLQARAGAKAPVCNKSKAKECTSCGQAKLRKSGKAAPAKCDPKKQKCKREDVTGIEDEFGELHAFPEDPWLETDEPENEIAKRAETVVAMYDTTPTTWAAGDSIMTQGLSVCSVVAVWDNARVIMAHIPPGLPQPNGDIMISTDVLRLYLGRIDTAMRANPLQAPKSGYFLASNTLSASDRTIVRNWAIQNGISLQTREYTFAGAPGARLTLSRPATGNGPVTDNLQNPGPAA